MNLSPTKISTFEDCGMKFKFRYINHYRAKLDSANLEFGKAIHTAIETFFLDGQLPAEIFQEIWSGFENAELNYSRYDNWEKLMESGTQLMELFIKEEATKFIDCYAMEDWLKFRVDSQTNFWGRGDWIGRVRLPDDETVNAIVDFKTSSKKYDESQIDLNDQLTGYYHGGKKYPFEIDRVIYVVFVKTKTPYIQWVIGKRNSDQVNEFLQKVKYYNDEICRGNFYKKYGLGCQWCDYQALCLGDEKRIKEELIVQVDDIQLVPGETHDLGTCLDVINPMDYVNTFIREKAIEGHFYFKVHKLYDFKRQEYLYELKVKELKRIYKNDLEEVV